MLFLPWAEMDQTSYGFRVAGPFIMHKMLYYYYFFSCSNGIEEQTIGLEPDLFS